MNRLAILVAAICLGLTLLSGNGFGLGQSKVGITHWASQTPPAALAKVEPITPRNWASPR